AGEQPTAGEYVCRFPLLATQLDRQLALHRALTPEAAPAPAAGAAALAPAVVLEELRRLDLLEAAQLDELGRLLEGQPLTAVEFGRELLRRDWLTPYQVNQLLGGRGRELVLGGHVLLGRLGQGGMGEVFKA